MSDNTTKRPTIQDSDLHKDTVFYRVCKPRVRVIEINVFEEIGTILNFRPSGLRVAREIIRRQHGENVTISCTDAELAAALWPDLPEATRPKKAVRAKQYLIEDQNNSNFRYVWKAPRQVEQKEDGSYYGLPSKYRPGDYWDVSDELQNRSNEQGREFLSMSAYKCRQVERELLTEILGERECKKIVRLRKKKEAKDSKEKPAPLPCRCNCDQCQLCAAKSATGSEANGVIKPKRLITRSDVGARMETYLEGLFECGQDWAELGLNTTDFFRKLESGLNILDQRLADAIKRHNQSSLKPVGGQPK